MINLEQIRILEQKVNNAVSVIARLKQENKALRETLGKSQKKMIDLETLLNSFKDDQEEIESGILDILDKLDRLEDETLEPDALKQDSSTDKKTGNADPVKKIPEPEISEDSTDNTDEIPYDSGDPAKDEPAADPEQEDLDIF